MDNGTLSQEDRIRRYADMIRKQSGRAIRPFRTDGYANMMTRYGTSKDSSEQYRFVPEEAVPDEMLTMFYEGNGLFAKIIDTPAEEAVKHGFTLEGLNNQNVQDFCTEALDELNWEETAMTAIKWARLFGGSIAVMLINDGRGLEEPLDWRNIRSIDDIRVYERAVVQPDYTSMFSYDPQDPFRTRGSRLGMPEYYHVTSKYGSFTVHDSRCLIFQNGILPENATNSVYQLWGIPEYIRLNRAILDAEIAHRSAPKLLDRSVQPVYKMKDLAVLLSTEEGEDQVLRRMQIIDMARGMLNSLVIDSDGEDYDFKTFPFAGVTDVVSASCNLLSAISNIPQTILFGRSVNGLSSTDDTSMENWYNYIERIDKRMVKPNLRYLLSVVFQAGVATGEIEEVPKIKVKFNPLWSMSDTEQAALEQTRAQTKQAKAQTAQIYVEMGALDPSEVRGKLADSEEFDVEDILEEDNENLFAGMEAQLGQEALADVKGHIAEEGDFDDYGKSVDLETAQAPVEEGNSSEAAPAATKLPQDMNEEEQEEAESISRGDGGPGSGNFGHEGRAGQVGGSLGELAMTAQGYSDPRQFIHENIKAIKAQGIKKPADAIAYWKDACYAKDIKPHETGVEEAIETIRYNVPSSTLHGWFVEANSTYKGRLEQAALSNDEVRNAGLNIAYENFKSLQRGKSDASISFDQFLDRPITVYRGKTSEHFVDGDDILSFSMDRKVAEKFAGANGKVVSTEIRPRDTIGSYQTTGEAEILVRRGNIQAAGYDGFNADAEWHDPVFWSEELEEMFEQEVGEEKRDDGGPGSGNWGHGGVKGQRGGSSPGGGVTHRIEKEGGGFTSAAKEKKSEKFARSESKVNSNVKALAGKGVPAIQEASKSIPKTEISSPEDKAQKYSGKFFEQIGYADPPKVVSEKKFEDIESDYPVQYRGIESAGGYDSFIGDTYYVSRGANGDGTNTTPDRATAAGFANGGTLIEMKLDKSAKVISDRNLMNYVGEFSGASPDSGVESSVFKYLSRNPGCIAAALGYDAIQDESTGWLNIVNRGKIIVKEQNTARSSQADASGIVTSTIKSREISEDGGPGSGNWGHTGVKGQLGGSAPGGGVSKRTGSKETGFSSEAKERAKAKAGGGSGSGGSTKNEGSKTSAAAKSSMTLDKSPCGALATDNDGEAWKKTDPGDFMNLQSGEVVSADELGEFGGSVVEYTGKTDFPQGSVSQDTMNQRLWGINEKEIAEKGYAEITSKDLEEMVGAVTHYGLGGDCQIMLATQDPDAYPDIMRTMSEDKKKSYGAEMEQVERFIAVSPKANYPVYRGVSFNDEMQPENAQRVLSQLKVGQEISMGHVASWSSSSGTAESYAMGAVNAEFGTGQDYSVVYRVAKPKSAVSLSGINPEGEHLTPRSARFRVNRVNHTYDDDLECHCYTVDMEEM